MFIAAGKNIRQQLKYTCCLKVLSNHLPRLCYGPKFNLHHQREMSTGRNNACTNSKIGYWNPILHQKCFMIGVRLCNMSESRIIYFFWFLNQLSLLVILKNNNVFQNHQTYSCQILEISINILGMVSVRLQI